jgi:hypothetical protein
VTPLDQSTLASVVSAAISRLAAAGVSQDALSALSSATYNVGDLGGTTLAQTDVASRSVTVSANAAGWGWYTGTNDSAFVNGRALAGTPAATEEDLLTTVLHEMTHLAGYNDLVGDPFSNDLLTQMLPTGVRRVDNAAAYF